MGHPNLRIRIGEVFRVQHGADGAPQTSNHALRSYQDITRGSREKSADIQKGIWAYKPVRTAAGLRTPALVLHSNPYKGGTEGAPWIDEIEPDMGYAVFHGDNRSALRLPYESRGNALLLEAFQMAMDPARRASTPPVLLFSQAEVDGSRKGYREFCGYGVPARLSLVAQREGPKLPYFTNVLADLVLFRLDEENEELDLNWIDLRRDGQVSDEVALEASPAAWRKWVREGETAFDSVRRRTARSQVTSSEAQAPPNELEASLLEQIVQAYSDDKHSFEGLAALVADRVLGASCTRAWVTKRSGDGGVDFVSRISHGSGFSSVKLVVLGQAKCTKPSTAVSGMDLARLVARLQRGWIGVFVTTGVFSDRCQTELIEDHYPVALVNGARLVREVRQLLTEEGIGLEELVARERRWYEEHVSMNRPERVLDDEQFGTRIPRPSLCTDGSVEVASESGSGAKRQRQ